MAAMTHKERFLNALNRQEVDCLPCGDGLWGETAQRYIAEGKLNEGEDHVAHFDMSWRGGGWLNSTADLAFQAVTVEETPETITRLDGNGARLRYWKARSGTPEHVGFNVVDRASWERLVKPHLVKTERCRIPFEGYRHSRALAALERRAFVWAGVAPFEQMHPVCGHEGMLVGMVDDPEWVQDMVMTYADFTRRHLQLLFREEGLPDAMWFYEDMGFKAKPFMSPAAYERIMLPGHRQLFEFAHTLGLKVIVHSCGYVEPLVPGLIAAGMDCLQAMEVKAGMDLAKLAARFADRICFCGGLDIRIIASNDRDAIAAEIARKVTPVLQRGSGFILHSDHSIPPEVDHDTLVYFFNHGRQFPRRLKG